MKTKLTSLITAIIFIATISVYAYDTWDPAETYATAGTIVQYDGKLWKNYWWTKGDNPTGYYSNQWHVWRPEVQPQENQAPSAVDDSAVTTENKSVIISPLSNDIDPDNDVITLASVGAPSHGTAVVSGDSVVYTPGENYTGTDSFSYTIADTEGNTDSATVNVTVKNDSSISDIPVWDASTVYTGGKKVTYNDGIYEAKWWTQGDNPEQSGQWGVWKVIDNPDPGQGPAAHDDSVVTENGKAVTINVLGNDTGTGLELDSVTVPAHGIAVISENSIQYTPETGFAGNDSFSYTVSDANSLTATAAVSVTVKEAAVPEEPVANNDTAYTKVDTAVTVDVLGNDTGEAVSLDSVTEPQNGTAVISGDKVIYTPNVEFKGTDSFNYTITDAFGVLATGLVTVTVNEPSVVDKVNATFWCAWGGNTSYNVDGKQIISAPVEMDKIDPSYNVIIAAFIITDDNGNYVLAIKDPGSSKASVFSPEQVKQFIEKTKAQGRKVIVSMGGALFHIDMKTQADGEVFVEQTKNIIDEYGFDGIDIDLEGTALASVDPEIMGNAIMDVVNYYRDKGNDFWLTAAPEWCYIIPFMYGSGQWASHSLHADYYKDLINNIGLENFTYIWPQSYNGGPANGVAAPDGSKVTPVEGMDKFLAAMAWGLTTTEGYKANGSIGLLIPPEKLCLGIPATEGAAGSGMTYVATPEHIKSACDLMQKYGVEVSGFMNWSVDWDAMNIADGDLSVGYTHKPWETGRAVAEAVNLDEPVNQSPVINVVTPTNNAVIEQDTLSAINIEFTATDNDGEIASTAIEVDGNIYSGTTVNWTPSEFGIYTVTFTAFDGEGATTTKTINVTIKEKTSISNQLPVISSVSPADGEKVEMISLSPITITVNASDPDGTVESTQIEVDGNTFSGSSTSWTPSEFGTHTIYVTVTDNDGATATAIANVEIIEKQGTVTSGIAFASPNDGDVIKQEELASVNITVSVTDTENVESVQIDVDGNNFDGYTANWTPSDFGSFAITAMVTYLSGAVETKTINVQIAEDNGAGFENFKIGGYWENWKGALNPGSSSVNDPAYYSNDMNNFSHVYYSFLTLVKTPNPDTPPNQQWDGQSIYESMTQADVMLVLDKEDYNYKWQGDKIRAMIAECHSKDKKFIWAIGGWSDLTQTISDEQVPVFVDCCVNLLKVAGDGIDFDWEHLSSNLENKDQQRHVIGKILPALRKALDENGMSAKQLGYTTRFNAFWDDSNRPAGALEFESEGEGIDIASAAKEAGTTLNDCVDWVNIMMYDVPPNDAGATGGTFELDNYKQVLNAFEKIFIKR